MLALIENVSRGDCLVAGFAVLGFGLGAIFWVMVFKKS